MGVKYLITPSEVNTVRPQGYRYPVGLTPIIIPVSANAATNTTGGTQTIDGDYAVHTYTTSGTFFFDNQVGESVDVEYLVIAGGGAGGRDIGGGGGAGGLFDIVIHFLCLEML